MNYSKKDLFGGAITSELPADWKDLSEMRQVPDHQESFLDLHDEENPKMLVVEILEFQKDVKDEDAAKFFFMELSELNDALQNTNDVRFEAATDHESPKALLGDESIQTGTNTVRVCAGSGYQQVAMGKDFNTMGISRRAIQDIKWIRVDVYVLRLPKQETDLVISLSSPAEDTNREDLSVECEVTAEILKKAVSTFRIENWGLFG